jgi:rod shape-determining protein MreC
VRILPYDKRAIVTGDNTNSPPLDFLDAGEKVQPDDRVVTSGDGGVFPPDLLIGQVVIGSDGQPRVRLSADFRRLDFIRVIRDIKRETIPGTGTLIGPQPEPRLSFNEQGGE